ncbi:MAG: radical SAM protein [Candidatus Omnitrophota bacterium]
MVNKAHTSKKESLAVKKSRRMAVDLNNPYPPFPREVFFDLNNACNSKCFFCSNHKVTQRDYLDKELGFKLLKDFYDNGTREVAFYATGEPFLRDDLADFVEKARLIGYEYIFISSNGIIANRNRAKPVLDAGLNSIKFSINAGNRETYKKVHGVDAFDKVIENVKWFYNYREESALDYGIYVSMVPSSLTQGQWPTLYEILKPYVDEMDYRGCSNQGGNILENNMTEHIDSRNLLGSLKNNQYTGRCPDIFFRCTVTPQGYLSACVVDYQNFLVVADLNKVSVKEAWHNAKYLELRNRHINADLDGLTCFNCLNNKECCAEPLSEEFARPFDK